MSNTLVVTQLSFSGQQLLFSRYTTGGMGMELTNLDEIEACLAQRFRAITVQGLSRTGRRPLFRFGTLPRTRVAMAAVDFGRAAVCRANQPIDFVPVHFPLRGSAEVRSGPHAFQSHPGVGISPGIREPLLMHTSEDWQMRVLRLPMTSIARELTTLLGYAPELPLLLHPRIDLTTPGGQRLRHLLLAAADETIAAPALALEDELVRALLLSQRHNYSEALAEATESATSALVRRAQDYLEANHHRAISATGLATALTTSVRSLSRGFRRHLGTSPMAYLRECRLQAARRALLEQHDGESVTQIALNCGFSHLGRFAVDYRNRFGECPSSSFRGTWRVPAAAAQTDNRSAPEDMAVSLVA